MDDLRFIRSTMERSSSFTAVPGWGGVGIGVLALAAAWVASLQPTPGRWLAVWLATASVAALIASATLALKARRFGAPLASGPGRKFLLSFLPPVGAAVALTAAGEEAEAAREGDQLRLSLDASIATTSGDGSTGVAGREPASADQMRQREQREQSRRGLRHPPILPQVEDTPWPLPLPLPHGRSKSLRRSCAA